MGGIREYPTPSPDDALEILINIISKTIEKMCPLKVIKINKLKEEWISQELIEQIKLKDELLTIAKRTQNILDWNRARRIRSESKLWVKNANGEYSKHQLKVNAKDSKKFWRNIQTIIPNQKRQTSITTLIDQSTKQYVTEDEVPDYINEYVLTVGSKMDTHRDAWIYPGHDVSPQFKLQLQLSLTVIGANPLSSYNTYFL